MAVCPHLRRRHSCSGKAPTQAEKTSKRQMFPCFVKGGNPSTMFLFPYSCRRPVKYLLPESLSFGVAWSCQLACPLARCGVLAFSRSQILESPAGDHWSDVWVRGYTSLKCVLSRKIVSSKHSSGNEKVIGEHRASGGAAYLSSLCFMIKHSLGDAQQYKVLNHWAGSNLRVHGHPSHFTGKLTEANQNYSPQTTRLVMW